MSDVSLDLERIAGYTLIAVGFLLLVINHITVVAGDPWLIPSFLRLY
ncbi:MAG: hypothetical protein KZQ93_17455 [Candidatus Thiodiazotropha sp. (ex Monitilora ramsayi)]|nr:hypothetical protein [Candidatus Thiodiazotropha sp. (ex Monitilora ramsayi)]